ncbi:MAG: hypothetical protein JW941_13650 [Candidatus Coatesbacteria bacterium]|nr:hypothetical protein [Candidatus Coatesbacteria bacterium]
MRPLAVYIGLLVWLVLAQGLFPVYNTHLDILLMVAALVPGAIMLVRRQIRPAALALGMGLSCAALISRFATRLLGLIRWDGSEALFALGLAHFVAFILAVLFALAILLRKNFRARIACALSFGFLLAVAAGIMAPDYLVDEELRYAIGQGISARELIEQIGRGPSEKSEAASSDWNFASITLARLPRVQLESLSDRFFDSPLADDARLISSLLLSPCPRRLVLEKLEPLLLSRRLDFHLEEWTASRLLKWRGLFRAQNLSREMFFEIAQRRLKEGRIADALAALNELVIFGDGDDGARAIGMILRIQDTVLGDVEGGLAALLKLLDSSPEYAFLPSARQEFGEFPSDIRERLTRIASENQDTQIRSLAHLRLFFSAQLASNEIGAAKHLAEIRRLATGTLSEIELSMTIMRNAQAAGGEAGVEQFSIALEFCRNLEAPILMHVSDLDLPEQLVDVPEIALRRLVMLDQKSIFWERGLKRLIALLRRNGRSREAEALIRSYSSHLDALSVED